MPMMNLRQLTNLGEPGGEMLDGVQTGLFTTSCEPKCSDMHLGGGAQLFTTSCEPAQSNQDKAAEKAA
jgi:hypothetical protein